MRCVRFNQSTAKNSATTVRASNVLKAGRALTEVLLIAVIPCFVWLIWSTLSADLPTSWNAASAAIPNGPLRTVRDIVDLGEGQILVVHRNGELRVWDAKTQCELGDLSSQFNSTRCGAFSAAKRLLAIGGTDGTLGVWNLNESPESPLILRGDDVSCTSCKFTPDGAYLLTGGGSGQVSIWDTVTWTVVGKLEQTTTAEAIHSLAVTADGKVVFAGIFDGKICKWDLEERRLMSVMVASKASQPNALIMGLFLNAENSELIAASRDGSISVWDHEQGREIRRCDAPAGELICANRTSDGASIVGVSEKGEVASWNILTGAPTVETPTKFHSKSLRFIASIEGGLVAGDEAGHIEFVTR